jgi:alpha-methylacyl-CoA racemase
MTEATTGPLADLRVIEFGGIGAVPFTGMMLCDMGAEVIRIEQPTKVASTDSVGLDPLLRGRRSIALDLKSDSGREVAMALVRTADAVIEGFRPGVMERLGFGYDECLRENSRVVYGRLTGWGQSGPLAQHPGHDINYLAVSGALEGLGRPGQPPAPPLNYLGDYAGGGMLMAFGMVCALIESARSGLGQIVDAAMLDGAALLSTLFHGMLRDGTYSPSRGSNVLDLGSPFYQVYECADGRHVAVGAVEPKFYSAFISALGLDEDRWRDQLDTSQWSTRKGELQDLFRTRTRDEWCSVTDGIGDACLSPVLSLDEAPTHEHNLDREAFVFRDGMHYPSPAPRFSRTPAQLSSSPVPSGTDTERILLDLGYLKDDIERLLDEGAVGKC